MKNGRNCSLGTTTFCYLMLDSTFKEGADFSLRDERLFEITEVEITGVDCIHLQAWMDGWGMFELFIDAQPQKGI